MLDTTPIAEKLGKKNIKYILSASMAQYSSFRSGGFAALLILPENMEELIYSLSLTRDVNSVVIGRGSNLLFCDEVYDGVVICTCAVNTVEISGADNILTADCGAPLSRICTLAAEQGLGGLEFAYGIPGSCAGAVYMNAGAYGGQISDVLAFSEYYDRRTGQTVRLDGSGHNFSYRHSIYSDNFDSVILRAGFALIKRDKNEIFSDMNGYLVRRREKQPLEYPSAGSVFKRPAGAYAGALIEQCGLKGFGVGGAEVSEKHAGFIINRGNATPHDICTLIETVRNRVFEKTGILLECEIKLIRSKNV